MHNSVIMGDQVQTRPGAATTEEVKAAFDEMCRLLRLPPRGHGIERFREEMQFADAMAAALDRQLADFISGAPSNSRQVASSLASYLDSVTKVLNIALTEGELQIDDVKYRPVLQRFFAAACEFRALLSVVEHYSKIPRDDWRALNLAAAELRVAGVEVRRLYRDKFLETAARRKG